MQKKIELRTATEDDIPRIEMWARTIDVGQFMSRHRSDTDYAVLAGRWIGDHSLSERRPWVIFTAARSCQTAIGHFRTIDVDAQIADN